MSELLEPPFCPAARKKQYWHWSSSLALWLSHALAEQHIHALHWRVYHPKSLLPYLYICDIYDNVSRDPRTLSRPNNHTLTSPPSFLASPHIDTQPTPFLSRLYYLFQLIHDPQNTRIDSSVHPTTP